MHMFEMWKMSIPVHLHMSVCMRRKSDTGSEASPHASHDNAIITLFKDFFDTVKQVTK